MNSNDMAIEEFVAKAKADADAVVKAAEEAQKALPEGVSEAVAAGLLNAAIAPSIQALHQTVAQAKGLTPQEHAEPVTGGRLSHDELRRRHANLRRNRS
jgi:hypothetical protein